MIKSFGDKETRQVFVAGKSKRLPPDLLRRAIRRLEYIDLARTLDDLKVPPSNRLHALKGDRKGNTRYPSMTSGAFVSASQKATPMTLKSPITIEEQNHGSIRKNQAGDSTHSPRRNASGRLHAGLRIDSIGPRFGIGDITPDGQ